MHEGGLVEGVLGVVLDAAEERPVRQIRLRIGQLQRVVASSFDFYWEMLCEGTPAAGAKVDIAEEPIRIRCRACGAENELPEAIFLCPACNGSDVEIVAGDRVDVECIELADGEMLRNPKFVDVQEPEHTHTYQEVSQ